MKNLKLSIVIGANATGKSTFIREHFSDQDVERLNVYDFQQKAYEEAGIDGECLTAESYRCLYKANDMLLKQIIRLLKEGRSVVAEHTLFKAKRRIFYIEEIRKAVNVEIEFFVMRPSDALWKSYISERKLQGDFQYHKRIAEELDFPNPAEGIDRIFQVVDGDIQLRMDPPNPGILPLAHQELKEEMNRMHREDEEKARRRELLDSMNERSFWHICEVCGKKVFCTAQEAFDDGWDYPPQIGRFGVLGPRTCGKCSLTDTLFWKIHQQNIPLVMESNLTEDELAAWLRIKGEPESLLKEE